MSNVEDLIDKLVDLSFDWDIYEEARLKIREAARVMNRLYVENSLLKRMCAGHEQE